VPPRVTRYRENFLQEEKENLKRIHANHGIILSPTETVLGLSVPAEDEVAVRSLSQLKNRSEQKAWLLVVDGWGLLESFIEKKFWALQPIFSGLNRKPLTFILPSQHKAKKWLNPRGNTLAFRITRHPILKDLITLSSSPLVSTSANRAQQTPPKTWKGLDAEFLEAVALVVEESEGEKIGLPSTVVEFLEPNFLRILRKGEYSLQEIQIDLPPDWQVLEPR